jgi:hypothetical protein
MFLLFAGSCSDDSNPAIPIKDQENCINYVDYLHNAGSVDTPGKAYSVEISGDYAYVADWSSLQVIDITTPTSPRIVGSVDIPGSAQGVAVSGNYAYVADGSSLQIIDIIEPASPRIVGSVDIPGNPKSVAISGSGNYAYIASGWNGLQIVRIASPSSPQRVGSRETPGDAENVIVSGDYAYVTGYCGLQIIPIGGQGGSVGSVSFSEMVHGVAVSGNYAYVAYWSSLRIIDIIKPSSPQTVGAISVLGGPIYCVAVSGSYICIG